MIDEHVLQQIVKRIVAAAHPSRVILFGSYARGEAEPGSDLDLMVIETQVPDPYAEMISLPEAVGPIGVGVDVLVYSDAEMNKRRDWCTSPVYWALREGRTLYAAH